MNSVKRKFACFIFAVLCAASYAAAQSQPSQAEAKAFASEYVAAYDAKDVAHLLALYDPASRACIAGENKEYRETTMALMWRDTIPANYTFTVSAVNENNLKAIETFGRFPIKPERELHIDYQQGEDSGTVILYLVQQNARWLADQPCASEQTIKQFLDDEPQRKALEAHYKSIADAIQEPLRSQLITLIREHKRGQATERYRETSGQDGRTAMLVIDQLAIEITR